MLNIFDYHSTPDILDDYLESYLQKPNLFRSAFSDFEPKAAHKKLSKHENLIAKIPEYAFIYARDALEAPFKKGEKAIATDPRFALMYARDILHGRFELGEEAIMLSEYHKKNYLAYLESRGISI